MFHIKQSAIYYLYIITMFYHSFSSTASTRHVHSTRITSIHGTLHVTSNGNPARKSLHFTSGGTLLEQTIGFLTSRHVIFVGGVSTRRRGRAIYRWQGLECLVGCGDGFLKHDGCYGMHRMQNVITILWRWKEYVGWTKLNSSLNWRSVGLRCFFDFPTVNDEASEEFELWGGESTGCESGDSGIDVWFSCTAQTTADCGMMWCVVLFVSLWSGRAWGVGVLILVVSPFLGRRSQKKHTYTMSQIFCWDFTDQSTNDTHLSSYDAFLGQEKHPSAVTSHLNGKEPFHSDWDISNMTSLGLLWCQIECSGRSSSHSHLRS